MSTYLLCETKSEKMNSNYWCWKNSPLGNIHLIADDESLLVVAFDTTAEIYKQQFNIRPNCDNVILQQARKELEEYFTKKRKTFSVPIRLIGTDFQMKVWDSLKKVPYGKKISYLQQAENLNMKTAVRAVASANGRNPISIIVPCHRILRGDGSLGGYSGGLNIKTQLLDLETT